MGMECLTAHMSYVALAPSIGFAGGRSALRSFEFGRTSVVRPKGKHQATIVWLNSLDDNGFRPKLLSKPISMFGGFPSSALYHNEKKIMDYKEMDATLVDGNGTEIGQLIVTNVGGENGRIRVV